MVFCGLFPIDGDDFENLRESLEKLKLNDASITLHAGVVRRARLRLPLRLPRPAAHGDREGAAGARVQPCADRHRAQRRVPGAQDQRRGRASSTTRPTSRPPQNIDFIEEPFFRVSIITPKEYTGTLMDLCQTAPRRADEAGVPVTGAGRAALPDPAGRGGRRLLRPDEEPHPGLRQPRLRAERLPTQSAGAASTCCSTESRPTRSRRSCTATRRSRTAAGCARS